MSSRHGYGATDGASSSGGGDRSSQLRPRHTYSETDLDRAATEDLLSGMETEEMETFSRGSEMFSTAAILGMSFPTAGSVDGESEPPTPELSRAGRRGSKKGEEEESLPLLLQRRQRLAMRLRNARGRQNYESLDYDPIPNTVFEKEVLADTEASYNRDARMRWVITLVIGMMVGVLAFFLDWGVNLLRVRARTALPPPLLALVLTPRPAHRKGRWRP